ncbi:MAG: hypothetical protein JW981_07075 [Anaerolineae bacterium]|nr:hypothetical protein [Anaerolineae bacterium]
MINRAREIAQMMGYNSIDATLEAIGRGELILLKVPPAKRLQIAEWLYQQAAEIPDSDLGAAIREIASGIELAAELERYPEDSDICAMEVPHGWPTYCEKGR